MNPKIFRGKGTKVIYFFNLGHFSHKKTVVMLENEGWVEVKTLHTSTGQHALKLYIT